MLIEEQDCECSILPIPIENRGLPGKALPPRVGAEATWNSSAETSIGLFEQSAPASFAEEFPLLMIFAVAASILVAAIVTEIDCLRGAGYYWP